MCCLFKKCFSIGVSLANVTLVTIMLPSIARPQEIPSTYQILQLEGVNLSTFSEVIAARVIESPNIQISPLMTVNNISQLNFYEPVELEQPPHPMIDVFPTTGNIMGIQLTDGGYNDGIGLRVKTTF